MLRRLAVVLVVVLVVGCSSSSDDAAPATTLEPTTTTAATTTSTTVASTTSSTEPDLEPEWTPEELAVIEAYDAYQAAWELAVEDWDAGIEAIRATSAGDYSDGVVAYFQQAQADGSSLSGSRSEYDVLNVEFVTDNRAILTECGIDEYEVIDADGEVLSPADAEPTEFLIYAERLEGQWLIVGLSVSSSC